MTRPSCGNCQHFQKGIIPNDYRVQECSFPAKREPVLDTWVGTVKCIDARAEGAFCGPDGLKWEESVFTQIMRRMREADKRLREAYREEALKPHTPPAETGEWRQVGPTVHGQPVRPWWKRWFA